MRTVPAGSNVNDAPFCADSRDSSFSAGDRYVAGLAGEIFLIVPHRVYCGDEK